MGRSPGQVLFRGLREGDHLVEVSEVGIRAGEGGASFQQHVQGGAIKPAFLNPEFAARGAKPVDIQ